MHDDLFDDVAHARNSDPETSHEAAASVKNITQVQHAVLRIISLWPSTDEQMIDRYRTARAMADKSFPQHTESGLRTRRLELERAGFIQDTGLKGTTRTGRKSVIWSATKAGKQLAGHSPK